MADPAPPDNNPLSEREREVSRLLVTGATNVEIARKLVISPHTVKVHLRNLFEKLQVSSRTEASTVLLQRGWVTIPGFEAPSAQRMATPLLPAPEPLADTPAQPLLWQRLYLLAATFTCLVVLAIPNWLTRPKTSFSLLSDAGATIWGQPQLETEPRWEARTPMLQPRSRMAVALTQDLLYVIGGEGVDGQALSTVAAYDLRFNEWHEVSALPHPLANASAAALHERIYVAGGSVNRQEGETAIALSDALLVFDPQSGQWQSWGKLPGPLAGAALAADETSLYLLGGWDGHTMHDEVWRLTPPGADSARQPAWELLSRLNVACAFMGATLADRELYVVGGYDGQRELDQAAVYHLETNEWRELASLSTPRSGLNVVYDGLAILALGGGWTRTVDTHERFDLYAQQWSNFPSPIRGEWRHFVAANRDGSVHLIGGWSGDYLSAHLQYQSTFRALLPVISND